MSAPYLLRAHRFAGPGKGARLIVTGAVHGNETAGTRGIERVIGEIERGELAIVRGLVTFVPVCNALAYAKEQRNGERNLNRRLQPTATPQDNEDRIANVLCPWLAEHESSTKSVFEHDSKPGIATNSSPSNRNPETTFSARLRWKPTWRQQRLIRVGIAW